MLDFGRRNPSDAMLRSAQAAVDAFSATLIVLAIMPIILRITWQSWRTSRIATAVARDSLRPFPGAMSFAERRGPGDAGASTMLCG